MNAPQPLAGETDVPGEVVPDPVEHWYTAWDAALHAVEIDVADAEQLIARMHRGDEDVPEQPLTGSWTAPEVFGPMPREFADRARALLQRQFDVSERLAEAIVQARSQRRALGKLDRAESRPVFVDTAL